MHPLPEITLDMTAADLLQTVSGDDTCFEVDDIAALDPIAMPAPAVSKAGAPPPTQAATATDEVSFELDSLEIELTAEDMNALFDAEATDKVK